MTAPTFRNSLITGALLLGGLACGPIVDDDPLDGVYDSFHTGLTMTAGEARLILELVNHPSTDVLFLDLDVSLNRIAADQIMAHRDGLDLKYPSHDDDVYGSLEELDAIKYVGPVALQRLRDYIAVNPGPMPEVVEGVGFSGVQAIAVVWGVNRAPFGELDVEVGLDRRAAENLLSAGSFVSVAEMGRAPYVGPDALSRLRAYAAVWRQRRAEQETLSLAGVFDGVTFDHDNATMALQIANQASLEQLTGEGLLWNAAAELVLAGREYADLVQLAETRGVGPATMQALHDYASSGRW